MKKDTLSRQDRDVMMMAQGSGRRTGSLRENMLFVQGGTLPEIENGEITVNSFFIGKHEEPGLHLQRQQRY